MTFKQWVKVVSALVRDGLFTNDTRQQENGRGKATPYAEVAADVLQKCGLLNEIQDGSNSSSTRTVDPEPYFCPLEYMYLSEAIIQRHHHAAPLTRKENAHFTLVKDQELMKAVVMEPIPDYGSTVLSTAASASGLSTSSSSSDLLVSPGGIGKFLHVHTFSCI